MSELDARTIVRRPVVTEKAHYQKEKYRVYHFEVDPRANKVQIKKAIEELYGVKVEEVRTMNMKPKPRRMRYRQEGKTPKWKKALVRLSEGDSIEVY